MEQSLQRPMKSISDIAKAFKICIYEDDNDCSKCPYHEDDSGYFCKTHMLNDVTLFLDYEAGKEEIRKALISDLFW